MSLPLSSKAVPFIPQRYSPPLAAQPQPKTLSPRIQLLNTAQISRLNQIKTLAFHITPNHNNLSVPPTPFHVLAFEKLLNESLKKSQEAVDSTWIMRESAESIITGTNIKALELCFAIPMTPARDEQLKKYRLELNEIQQQLKKFKNITHDATTIKETLHLKNKMASLQAKIISPFANAIRNIILSNLANVGILFEDGKQIEDFINEEYLNPQRFREIRHYEGNSSLYKIVGYRIELGEVTLNFVFTTDNDWQKTYFPQDSYFVSMNMGGVTKSDKVQLLENRRISLEEITESESPFFHMIQRMTQGFQADQKLVHEVTEKACQGLKMISNPETLKEAFEKFLNAHFNCQIPAPLIRNSDKKHSLPKMNPLLTQIYKACIADENPVKLNVPEIVGRKVNKLIETGKNEKANKLWIDTNKRLGRICATPAHLMQSAAKEDPKFINTVQQTFRKGVKIDYIQARKNEISPMMACLNTFSLLESVPDTALRHNCAHVIAKTLANQTRLQNFTKIIEKYPQHLFDVLNLVKGLFLYGLIKKQSGLSAYTFPFAENERTVRCHFSWQHNMGCDFLAINDDPVKTAVKFLNSWRNLEKGLSNDKALLPTIAKNIGISIPDLTPENRLQIAQEILEGFEKSPVANILSQQFNGVPSVTDFATAIAAEHNIPSQFAEYLSQKITLMQLKKALRNPVADEFTALRQEIYNCLLLPLNKLPMVLGNLFTLLAKFPLTPSTNEISQALHFLCISLISSPSFDNLRLAQELFMHAGKAFTNEIRSQLATSIIKANEKLGPSLRDPIHFFSLNNFILTCGDNESLQKELGILKAKMMNNLFATAENFATESHTTQLALLPYFQSLLASNNQQNLQVAFRNIIRCAPNIQNESVLKSVAIFITDNLPHVSKEFLDGDSLFQLVLKLLPSQNLGLKLAVAIAKHLHHSKIVQDIQTYLIENLMRTANKQNRLQFVNYAQALSQLEGFQKHNVHEFAEFAKDDVTFFNKLNVIVEKLLKITNTLNPSLNSQFLLYDTVKRLVPSEVRHPMGWKLIQTLSATKEVKALEQALKLCSDLTAENSFAKSAPDWLMAIETTVQLLNNFADLYKAQLNGESEYLADAFKNLLEFGKHFKITLEDIAPICNAFISLYSHNKKAWKLVAEPLTNFLVDKKLIKSEMKPDFKLKKLSPHIETATDKLHASLDTPTQALIEAALKENTEQALVFSLKAFQKLSWTDSLKGLAMHLLMTASSQWKGQNTHDAQLLEFTSSILQAKFLQNLDATQRKACFASIVASEKSKVVINIWKELSQFCPPDEITSFCQVLAPSRYVYLIQDYVVNAKPINIYALTLLLEMYTKLGEPRLAKWLQNETQIFLNRTLPIKLRVHLFQLTCEYFATIAQKESNTKLLQSYISTLSPIWPQLEADPEFPKNDAATKINHSLLYLLAKEGSTSSLDLIMAYIREFNEPLPAPIISQILVGLTTNPCYFTKDFETIGYFFASQVQNSPNLLNSLLNAYNVVLENPAYTPLIQKTLERILNNPNIQMLMRSAQTQMSDFLVKFNLELAKQKKMESIANLKTQLEESLANDLAKMVREAIENKLNEMHRSLKKVSPQSQKALVEQFPLAIVYNRSQATSMVLRYLDVACKTKTPFWHEIFATLNQLYSMNIYAVDVGICETRLLSFLLNSKDKNMNDIALDRLTRVHHFIDFSNESLLKTYLNIIQTLHFRKLKQHLESSQNEACDKFLEIIKGIYLKEIPQNLYPVYLNFFVELCRSVQIQKDSINSGEVVICRYNKPDALKNTIKSICAKRDLEFYEELLHNIFLEIMSPNRALTQAELSHQTNTNHNVSLALALHDIIIKAQNSRSNNTAAASK